MWEDIGALYEGDVEAVRGQHYDLVLNGVEIGGGTRFAQDLEWDSLTVMDFVASVEDDFDILISMNRAAEIETVDQLVDAVRQLESER